MSYHNRYNGFLTILFKTSLYILMSVTLCIAFKIYVLIYWGSFYSVFLFLLCQIFVFTNCVNFSIYLFIVVLHLWSKWIELHIYSYWYYKFGLVSCRDVIWGWGKGEFAPPWIWKIVIFVFLHTKYFCFLYILPPPRKSVKIVPPPGKTEMTFLGSCMFIWKTWPIKWTVYTGGDVIAGGVN